MSENPINNNVTESNGGVDHSAVNGGTEDQTSKYIQFIF